MATGFPESGSSAIPLALTTLGGASLASGADPLLAPGKPLALVTYLALAPGRSATREFLLDLLWADLGRDRARHALRQTLWQLRQLLGESVLTGREELTLSIAIESDRDRFLAAVEARDPEASIALYRGEFLPGFALPGSTEFEHWADIERNRLRAAFLRTAELAVRRRLAAGRFRDAQDVARRMRDADRLSEAGWRLLIESLVAHRDLVQAAVEADSLRSSLIADGRDPEPATTAILATLRRAQGEGVEDGHDRDESLMAELVGREREFAALLEVWSQASRGPGRHVHVGAPAGLGKSRLLGDVAHRLRSIGARVVQVRANPGDRSVPYAFAGDLATALGGLPGLAAVSPATADVLVGLSPSLSSRFASAQPRAADGDSLRLRTAALVEAVHAIAEEHPLALVVDDVHWLDAESWQVLDGVIHRLDRAPVLVLTAGRPGVGRTVLTAGSVDVGLEPLGPAEIRALFVSLGRLADEPLLDAIFRQLEASSGGSPLLVLEALQLALDRGTAVLADGVWAVPDPAQLLAELERGNAVRSRLATLDADAAWVLLVLATAGTPLTVAELSTALRARGRVDEQLWALERKGFLRHSETSWEPAHDEIAAAAQDQETAERRRAAHGAVGRILVDNAGRRLDPVLQAARHFGAAGDDHALRLAYRRAVQVARQAGDRRGSRALAEAVSGGDEATAARLVRSLPIRTRIGLHSNARLAAAGLAAFALGTSAWVIARATVGLPPDAELLIATPHPGDSMAVDLRTVGVTRRGWRGGVAFRLPRTAETIRDSMLARVRNTRLDLTADGRLAFNAAVDNFYTDDIFVREHDHTRRLFPAGRDDVSPVWSPDDRHLVFLTARWSPAGGDDYDLAITDWPAGDSLRRLTATSDFDGSPAWAPHGGLIAFHRQPRELRPRQACWITPDGRVSHCVASTIGEVSEIVGWLDGGKVLLTVDYQERIQLASWDLAADQFRILARGAVTLPNLSPDGRWVVCLCARDANEPPVWSVFPIDDWLSSRPLTGVRDPVAFGWAPRPDRGERVRVRIQPRDALRLPLGASYDGTATVVDTAGDRVLLPASALYWSSRDTTIVAVASASGRITARRLGRTVVTADFGGVARDSIEVVVRADTAETIFSERWAAIDAARWRDFGEPPPRLTSGPGGVRGLNNGGDGRYTSGVFSTDRFDVSRGLGLEAKVSLPVSRSQWQQQIIALRSERSVVVDGWDRRSGYPWRDRAASGDECAFAYPSGEGLSALGRFSFSAGGATPRSPADSSWREGAWHVVRLQLFPDGTCGIAVDGVPVWRSEQRVSRNARYRVWLEGNSAGTNLVVGPVELWRGIRQDLDWQLLDSVPHRPERADGMLRDPRSRPFRRDPPSERGSPPA